MRFALFDLDGTLVDSVPDLQASLDAVLAGRGLAGLSRDEIVPMIGDGAGVLLQRAFAARGQVADAAARDAFLSHYGAHAADRSRPYPGTAAALSALREAGWRLGVCTNKPQAPARALLAALGLDGFFEALGGGDSFAVRKPDGGHLLQTLAQAGAQGVPALMVGDHRNDVEAARSAGLPCVFAAWGYGAAGMADGAQAVARSMSEVPALAERLLP